MTEYDDGLTLEAALGQYFAANGFGEDGGYSKKWVTGKFGPVPFAFPNVEARVRAVRFHDLHHVVTGYETDGPGEAEISAWEIATGCRRFWAAWMLNLNGMVVGLLLAPGRVYRAFVRGRRSANLYGRGYGPDLLGKSLGAIRSELLRGDSGGAAGASDASLDDRAAFVFWTGIGSVTIVLELSLVLAPIAALAGWLL